MRLVQMRENTDQNNSEYGHFSHSEYHPVYSYNHFHNMLRLLSNVEMFYRILRLPQVKRCAIITYKRGIYELPHELPNDLRLRILGN